MKTLKSWTKTSDGLPEIGEPVQACYLTRLGKLKVIRAMWISKNTIEAFAESDIGEYDEKTDTYYNPEGWYECIDNWDDYCSVMVDEGPVLYWTPLSIPPDVNRESLESGNNEQ